MTGRRTPNGATCDAVTRRATERIRRERDIEPRNDEQFPDLASPAISGANSSIDSNVAAPTVAGVRAD